MNTIKNYFPIIFLTLALGFLNPADLAAQNDDKANVERAIENYVVGWRTGNIELLKKTFDVEAGVVLWVDTKGESERLKSMTLLELATRVKPQDSYGIGYKIQNLEIIDAKLAIALVKIPLKKSHYIDCLELQKINGEWKIVLKSFVYFPKHQVP